jgi:hypothetical protein
MVFSLQSQRMFGRSGVTRTHSAARRPVMSGMGLTNFPTLPRSILCFVINILSDSVLIVKWYLAGSFLGSIERLNLFIFCCNDPDIIYGDLRVHHPTPLWLLCFVIPLSLTLGIEPDFQRAYSFSDEGNLQ